MNVIVSQKSVFCHMVYVPAMSAWVCLGLTTPHMSERHSNVHLCHRFHICKCCEIRDKLKNEMFSCTRGTCQRSVQRNLPYGLATWYSGIQLLCKTCPELCSVELTLMKVKDAFSVFLLQSRGCGFVYYFLSLCYNYSKHFRMNREIAQHLHSL